MSPCHCSTSHPLTDIVVTGSAEEIRALLCGAQQHDEHMRGYRWFLYVRDSNRRAAERDNILMDAARGIREARLTSQQLADIELAAYQERRRLA